MRKKAVIICLIFLVLIVLSVSGIQLTGYYGYRDFQQAIADFSTQDGSITIGKYGEGNLKVEINDPEQVEHILAMFAEAKYESPFLDKNLRTDEQEYFIILFSPEPFVVLLCEMSEDESGDVSGIIRGKHVRVKNIEEFYDSVISLYETGKGT